ncbi:Protein FAM199X [Nymphon striatum]|nr:Protein FAM199X [Nymphon striatum]
MRNQLVKNEFVKRKLVSDICVERLAEVAYRLPTGILSFELLEDLTAESMIESHIEDNIFDLILDPTLSSHSNPILCDDIDDILGWELSPSTISCETNDSTSDGTTRISSMSWNDFDSEMNGSDCSDLVLFEFMNDMGAGYDAPELYNSEEFYEHESLISNSRQLVNPFEANISWSDMSSDLQRKTIEIISDIIRTKMEIRDRINISKILKPKKQNPEKISVSDVDIDINCLDDIKLSMIRNYVRRYGVGTFFITHSENFKKLSNFYQLSTHKKNQLLKKELEIWELDHRDFTRFCTEFESGLFSSEEILTLQSRDDELESESEDILVDVICDDS